MEGPEFIGNYEVVRALGRGAMGAVYLAKDPRIGRTIAIKLVRADADESTNARERLLREARSVGQLTHPNIVTIFEIGEHEGSPFIAMEYVDGQTLDQIVQSGIKYSVARRLRWLEDVCAGLAYAHNKGVIHRDIKPSNLIVSTEGDLKILDFGLARHVAVVSGLTMAGSIVGTANYMSPEQWKAEAIDPRTDQFSVGAVLYEVLTGRRAFAGEPFQAMRRIVSEAPRPIEELLPGTDPDLQGVIDRALQKEPRDRYPSLTAMETELARVRARLEENESITATLVMAGTRPSEAQSGPIGLADRDERRDQLVKAMRSAATPRERCRAGTELGRLGDPRFRADAWWLPTDAMLGFIEVPAGPFTMGSDKKRDSCAIDHDSPEHLVDLPRYFIGKWPVTVAQFKAFAGDADNDGFSPTDPVCLDGALTHPVVWVSWYEALAYGRWLTRKLRTWDGTPEPLATLLRTGDGAAPWRVTLPSEAEWEKSARGPGEDGRTYPWGDKDDPNRANYGGSRVGGTSAVGCFPDGASPLGVEDLCGNVWEWTRSLWGIEPMVPEFGYPYQPDYEGRTRENLAASSEIRRVVRGGAFTDFPWNVRNAFRVRYIPDYPSDFVGFRLVVSPFTGEA